MTSSTTLASAPGDCCTKGFRHTGSPVGTTVIIAGVQTYVSEPKDLDPKKKVVLFFSDIYGSLYLNNQLVQDYFAGQGFIVLGPDYFFGDPIQNHANEEGFDRPAWMAKSKKQADECVPKWLEAVKEKFGTTGTKYSAVGYCFGAPYTVDLGATDFIVAAAVAHPAFLEESHFEKIQAPLLLSCAEIDHTFPLESRRRAEDILAQRKSAYHIQVFSGVKHGFASRGDPENPDGFWAKEQSARGIMEWFKRFSA
jgi:dienelactone hydrolase